jgi:hypothetical protein
MKKMKTTAAIVALAACAGTQLFAQSVKECTITFSLTVQQQASVSTSATVLNAGAWSQRPTHYKTTSSKITQVDILRAISVVMHKTGTYYTSQAKLVLEQSELGGFWNIDDELAQSYANWFDTGAPEYGALTGTFNYYDWYTDTLDTGVDSWTDVFFPEPPAGYTYTTTHDGIGYDLNDNTAIGAGELDSFGAPNTYAQLDTGRHFLPAPNEVATAGAYPVGHMQPWGQIFVKDPGHKNSAGEPLCENVTFFFALAVEECYDCFYLSSFISDANFTFKPGAQVGPPCCTPPESLIGKGVDKYYMALAFDNTVANQFLNPALYTNEQDLVYYYYDYSGYTGLTPAAGATDGLTPDLLPYVDTIKSALETPSPYEMRFTLAGIVTYNWNLQFVNKSDLYADYVGTATYSANGFGFIKLVCSLLTGSATFSEKIVKDVGCCDTALLGAWYNNWYGLDSNESEDTFFNPDYNQYNRYPYYDNVGGYDYYVWDNGGGYVLDVHPEKPDYHNLLPYQWETPFNPGPAITHHGIIDAINGGGAF